ncbi:replicative DNA helicase [Neobacillus notoginsengisoli]|uniref:Replicative DNA helicase n=1 Tax=Neobacillus notoginsengisoli TaxID=1578198 RepID=A0A417Z0Q7_9BACI|nr:replicative DNA helicase [Neobacillus notoginsengisoli]RHW43471.1 replicative DNA helicase [Neobacillus notoginsengisoli]
MGVALQNLHAYDGRLFNQEAEEAFVGAFFLDGALMQECSVQPEQLYNYRLRRLFAVLQRLHEKGKPIGIISVAEEAGIKELESLGGISYITDIAVSVPTTANFHFYQNTVKAYNQKRRTIEITGKIRDKALEEDIQDVLSDGINQLRQIEDMHGDEDAGEIQAGLVDLYIDCGKDLGEITGIPSGFQRLDKLTGGFQESDLVVIGARQSMGKTAFALNIALNAGKQDVTAVFSHEMSKKQLLKRAASCIGSISSVKMRNPKRYFDDEDWDNFSYAMGTLCKRNIRIFDNAGMDISYIWSKVRQLRKEIGEEKRLLVVVDYLQLIAGSPKHQQNRQAEISEISRLLKQMARETNAVVIALSQLSRGVESRQDKRPMLSDLRESGQIEQDADVIAFLYREEYYGKKQEEATSLGGQIIEVIVAKQRNGPIGTVELGFLMEVGRFG